ncbi:MAG: trans-sulfuration enzyme family protein [Acidobacteriota bacterium]
MNRRGFSTTAVHAGEEPDFREGASGDVVAPIHLSTTFARRDVDVPTAGYEYSRSLNPTRKALEEKLAAIENATYGLSFSSGLAAETTVILSLLKNGDHIVAFDDLYGGTKRLFNQVLEDCGIGVTYVDATDPSNLETAIRTTTRLMWLETPTNPLLKLCDIRAASEIARHHGLILVVDNTFLSPLFQHPLELGADIVLHSSTKYIGGHSDVINGSVMTSDDGLYEKIRFKQNAIGAVPSPFDCFLVMRGIKTLELRMRRHEENALAIARWLERHPRVKRVIYPGLKSHPQYELALKQTSGHGGIVSFELAGSIDDAKRVLSHLTLFAVAESLGGVESLIELPSVMTHAAVAKEERERVGISDALIRISAGIENADDLIDDLSRALMPSSS